MPHGTIAMKDGAGGFTLIELLTVMAVLAIVAGISVPSFVRIVERQRMEAAMQRLSTDLALARTSAIARRQPVVVCPRNAAGACQPGLDWSDGWVVFVEDPRHPGQGREVLGVQQALGGGAHAIMLSANRSMLRYRHDGSSPGSNLTFHLCLRGQVVAQQIVSNSGRVRRHQPEEEVPCPG